MEQSSLKSLAHRRASQSSGAIVAVAGAMVLVGWWTHQPILLGLRASYIPMAPNTAMAFVVLGAGLFAVTIGRRAGYRAAGIGAALVGLVGMLRLGEFLTGADLSVDRWFFHVRVEQFGLAPKGKMSLPTSVALVASSAAVLMLARPARWRLSGRLAGACGLIAGMTGLVFSLGYLFSPNSPLLYGTQSIPMALNTALCFLILGAGTASAAGPDVFPLRPLSGPSIRARLLRIFLPLVVGTVGVVAWLTHVVTTSSGASSAAISSAALATAAIFLFGIICERIADRVGGQIEAAETALQRANDLLESKVEERTRALSRALQDIQTAHESLLRAHVDLKLAQSRMLQQARLASLGETAAGVAHEINNPLAFVTNNLAILKREIGGLHGILLLYQEAAQTLAEYQRDLYAKISHLADEVDLPYVLANVENLVERSRSGLLRIQKIVADLSDFAHLQEAEFKEVDLNEGIKTTVRLMQGLADKQDVSIETDLAAIPRITCFPAKINLAVQSLISNAIDACPPGGKIVIETRAHASGTVIQVLDNGRGIPPAIREKVFDPFFTTKPVGKGTGLGLAISYGIVKDHGGTIDFESSCGEGTCFSIRLPLAPPKEPVASSASDGRASMPPAPL